MTARLPLLPAPAPPVNAAEHLDDPHQVRRKYLDHYARHLAQLGYQVRMPAEDDLRGNPTRGQTMGWLRVEGHLCRVVFDPDTRQLRGGWARVDLALSAREIDTLRALVNRSRTRADRRLRTRNYDDLGAGRTEQQRAYDQEKAEFLGRLHQRLAHLAADGPAPSGRPGTLTPDTLEEQTA